MGARVCVCARADCMKDLALGATVDAVITKQAEDATVHLLITCRY